MSIWTDINRLRLIKAFRRNPELWCKSHPDYSSLEKRKVILAELTKFMNKYEKTAIFTEEDIKAQLKNLKDMYKRKVKKMEQLKAISQKVEEPSWFYFEHLKFLDLSYDDLDILAPFSSCNYDEFSNEAIKNANKKRYESNQKAVSPPSLDIKSEISEICPNPDSHTRSNKFKIPAKRLKLSSEEDYQTKSYQDQDSCDDLNIFGQFVGTTLRKLNLTSPAMAIQVKKQINDLLCEAELQVCQFDAEIANIFNSN